MAAPPVLLVADDLAVIASVKRVLAREGYECVLATNAADAIIAFGHLLPGLIILQPSVERDRGNVVLEELQLHPDAKLLRCVILGETIPGFAWPVEPLPLEPEHFATVIADNLRTTDEAGSWSVLETAPLASPPAPHETTHEPEAWRATPPHESDIDPGAATEDVPEPQAIVEEPRAGGLEDRLFGDLAADVEAEAMQSVEASLPRPQASEDEELDRLEAEVRAEAQRRRVAREAEAVAVKPAAPTPPSGGEETARFPAETSSEQSFESLSDAPAAPHSRAAAVLSRAEQMVFESRAQSESGQRADEAELKQLREALEATALRAQDAEAALALAQEKAQAREGDFETERELARVRHENELEAQQQEAAAALEAETKRRAEAELALAAEQEQRVTVEQRLDDVTAQLTAATTEAGSLAQVAAELEGTKKRVADLLAEVSGWEEMATAEEARRSEVEVQLADRDAASAQLAQRLAELEAADVEGTSRRQELEAQLAAREARLAALTAAEEEDRATRQALEARVIELESKTDAAQSTRAELEQEVVQVEALLTEAHQHHEELQQRLAASEQQRAELAQRLAALEAETRDQRATLEQRAALTTTEAQSLTQRLAEREEEVSQLTLALQAARADAEAALSLANEGVEGERSKQAETRGQLERLARQLADAEAALALATEGAEAERSKQAETREQLARQLADAEAALALATEGAEAERGRHSETRAQREVLEQQLAETKATREAAQTELLQAEQARDAANAQVGELTSRIEGLLADVTSTSALAEETARERDHLRARVAVLEPLQPLAERLGTELEAENQRRQALEQELAAAQRALDEETNRLEALEATATVASEKVKQLEAREVMPISIGKRALGVARHGTVTLEGLARVVSQLVIGNVEVRLELGVSGGTRALWFKRGQIIAAESTVELEGLIARARRDGLIDVKQDGELRMLKGATPREQLEALKSRGFIRDIESVPLVQRYTEQVALDAFVEPETTYRIVEEAPAPEVLLATVPRPTLPMLAESLRRAVSPDAMLEQLGGGEAVPAATDSELDLRALGFSERERKMLSWVDGEATIEDLSLASGLKPDLAFRALLVAQLLGVLQVKPGTKKVESSSGQLDLHRLEAKYDEVQDADYFTILGLSRAAGSDDVRRAFQRLSQEFDPLRFSGHPDPQVQQHAQVVANLLEEAARALEDDRRRVDYARHLLD